MSKKEDDFSDEDLPQLHVQLSEVLTEYGYAVECSAHEDSDIFMPEDFSTIATDENEAVQNYMAAVALYRRLHGVRIL